jgi:hypothetical protein
MPSLLKVHLLMSLPRIRLASCFPLLLVTASLVVASGDRTFGAELQADQWLRNPLQWSFEKNTVRTQGRDAEMAVLQAAPVSTRVTVEADVEVTKVVGEQWKVAGVAIVRDPKNFWHFAMVQSPASEKQRHFCELGEMRDGHWPAQGNLRVVARETKPERWQLGQRYRLRIALDPAGIEGTLTDRQGRVVERIRYAFSAEAVKSGRPALRSHGFEATFTQIAMSYAEPDRVAAPTAVPYHSESFVQEVRGKKTGFFHVEQQGNAWWAVDPLGRGFVPLGVDHATFHGHGCEKLGYAPYHRKNQAKYKTSAPWAEETLGRLRSWGFNLLGAGCSAELNHRGLAHTAFAAFGTVMADQGDAMDILPDRHIPCSAFPNVFHPDFEAFCRYRAHQVCRPHVGDPWLFGYFLDNELDWWGHSNPDTGLFEAVMHKSATHTAKLALRDFLASRYDKDIARFNKAWGTQLASFDELLQRDNLAEKQTEAPLADKRAFIALIADRYFGIITRAIREVDPDHMILGCRFAGGYGSDGVWQAAGRYCDIITFNYYGNVDLNQGIARDHHSARQGKPLGEAFQAFFDLGRRPMMVTEWSFPALDAGLPSRHGAGQRFRTQPERAKATEITARTMLALPYLIGYDYFMWVDEPALGISEKFPEDSNYGLVNEDNKPYELLTAALTRVHQESGRLRREGPSRSGVVANPSPAALSPLARFLEKTPAQAAKGQAPHPALRFERKGEEFLATNGPLEIRGKVGVGGLTREVRHRGLVLGRFNGMIQQWTGQNQWVDVDRLANVQAKLGPRALAVDLVGRYDAGPNSPRRPFEVAYRLTLLPERDWFIAEILWCRNTGDQPLDLRAIYFRLYSTIGGSGADDVAMTADRIPRLWDALVGDAWLDQKAGAYWGLAAGDADPVKIYFWLDKGQHPDARLELEQKLAPNETFRPATPVAVLSVAGRGDHQAWESQSQQALDSLGSR